MKPAYALIRHQASSGTWYWGVHFRRRGRSIARRFYDPKWGGAAQARRAAIAWRDEQLAQAEALSLLEFCQQKRSNNHSGVAGVPEGIWQAKLKIAGKARHKSFSVKKHGWQPAYEMAVAARQDLLAQAQAQDRLYLYDRQAKKAAAAGKERMKPAAGAGRSDD